MNGHPYDCFTSKKTLRRFKAADIDHILIVSSFEAILTLVFPNASVKALQFYKVTSCPIFVVKVAHFDPQWIRSNIVTAACLFVWLAAAEASLLAVESPSIRSDASSDRAAGSAVHSDWLLASAAQKTAVAN